MRTHGGRVMLGLNQKRLDARYISHPSSIVLSVKDFPWPAEQKAGSLGERRYVGSSGSWLGPPFAPPVDCSDKLVLLLLVTGCVFARVDATRRNNDSVIVRVALVRARETPRQGNPEETPPTPPMEPLVEGKKKKGKERKKLKETKDYLMDGSSSSTSWSSLHLGTNFTE